MKKAVIFGAGVLGRYLYDKIKYTYDVLGFVSNMGEGMSPSALFELDFDIVFIANYNALEDIYNQLINDLNIPANKICKVWSEIWAPGKMENYKPMESRRLLFLESFAFYVYSHNIEGNTAELGVFRGDFAKEINRLFFNRKLYLFDTFEGFDERDLKVDRNLNVSFDIVDEAFKKGNYLSIVDGVNTVKSKLPFPELAIVKKGYFPETFDLADEKFVFVNIDTDLYQPTKAGLERFYPLMVRGGIILIHDYFTGLAGVTQAVDEFCESNGLTIVPNGDYYSAVIIKQ